MLASQGDQPGIGQTLLAVPTWLPGKQASPWLGTQVLELPSYTIHPPLATVSW